VLDSQGKLLATFYLGKSSTKEETERMVSKGKKAEFEELPFVLKYKRFSEVMD